jgi:hypothetical protein
VAKADPENIRSVPPIQMPPAEAADALARHMPKLMGENSVHALANLNQWRVSADPKKHLNHLETSLCTIAKDLKLADPELQARAIRKELVRRIHYLRSSVACQWRYGRFVESGEHQSKRSDAWLCYVIRYTNNRRKLGHRRGYKPMGNPASARKEAAAKASTIKTRDQLTPVEQRAFDLLKGGRHKSDKHPIEQRAIQLAKAVEDEWFNARQEGRPKGKWSRKPDAEAESFDALKPPLTLTDLVSIAREVIEDFARRKIALRDVTFAALWHIVCAHSEVIIRKTSGRNIDISRKAVQEALSRIRRDLMNPHPDLVRIEDSTSGP